MEAIQGKTGIVIHAGISKGARTVGKLLHAMHLDALLKQSAAASVMVIVVDGNERREPFYEAHFVECAAGAHEVAIYSHTDTLALASSGMEKAYSGKTLRVVVPEGDVVHLTYTAKGVPGASVLELGIAENAMT